jgi:glutamyl-tRNA synthetase
VSALDGRYAPSPSGPLHLGNLRTALLAWLFARSRSARFVLRIEDLDPQRSRAEYEQRAIEDLHTLGLDWDPSSAGAAAALLHQSTRGERYREAFERLRAAGRVYPCWCTREEVRLASEAPHADQQSGAYPGTCRHLSSDERAARERSGRANAWRLDARGEIATFCDALHGERAGAVDDFVLWRGDGVPAYNLAVVVDDADQEIGEVVRGDDLLETTPRQILLGQLLGFATPRYAHVPLVLGGDGKRLAKRHGAVSLPEVLAAGAAVEQVIGWMAASAGLVATGSRLGASELLARFDPARLTRSPTVLDERALRSI